MFWQEEVLGRQNDGEGKLRKLFVCLNQTLECMRDYLIGADIISLYSKVIYFSEESIWFVYDLSERLGFGKELAGLEKNILEKIDYGNRELVCRCYRIFDIVSYSPGGLQEIINVLEEKQESVSMSERGSVAGNGPEIVSRQERCIEEHYYADQGKC